MEEIKKENKDNDEEKIDNKEIEIPEEVPVLAVRDIVIFPYMILPLFVGRDISVKAVEYSLNSNRLIFLLTQRDFNVENPEPSDLYSIGTVCMIMRMLRLPDGRLKILVQGLSKARALSFKEHEGFYVAKIEKIEDVQIKEITLENEAMIRTVKEQLEKVISLGKNIPPDAMVIIENIDEPGRLADLIASNLGLKSEQAQEILEINNPIERLHKINEILNKEIQLLTIQQKIQKDARNEMDKLRENIF
jgi:ATP-dependent proteinase. Serine peptidase. MEROPS family S16